MKYSTALITGASRGLGKSLALELASRGVGLVLVARGKADLEQVAEQVRRHFGADYPVVAIAADMSDKNSIYPLVAQAAAAIGPIELLVNGASSLGPIPLGVLMDTACEDLEAVLQSNLIGPFRLIKALAGPMLLREKGLILNISSDAAIEAYPRWGIYSVSKAALDHLGRIFAAELEGTGVKLLSIDPGEMDTRMHSDAVPEADPQTLEDPARVAKKIARIIEASGDLASGTRLVAAQWAGKKEAV